MGWIQSSRRASAIRARRPGLEFLESRQVLSTGMDSLPLDLMSVQPASGQYQGPSNGFDTLIGASAAREQYKVDGRGLAVAVIDAGVNYDHPALGGGYGPNQKVSGGYDFAGKDSDPMATGLQHGTAVAGLIASSDPNYPGVAPGAGIVPLRVFDDANKSDFRMVADSLQWVVENHDAYNISVVNISLSDGRNYTRNWYGMDNQVGQRITGLISKLEELKIPVVTATGNSFTGQQGSGFTGIVADSISVTASDGNDQIVASAQRLGPEAGGESATDLAAPGVGLFAPTDKSGFAGVGGTSFAAPLVSGSIILLQQVYQHRFSSLPSVSDLETWLKKSAVPIKDSVTGLTIGRLDIPKAIQQIPMPAAQELKPPTAPVTPAPTPTPLVVTVTPLTVPATPVVVPVTPPVVTPETLVSVVDSPKVTTPETAPKALVWLNGRLLDPNAMDSSASQSGISTTALGRVLRSMRDWWATSRSRVRVWGLANGPTETQLAGIDRPTPAETAEAATPSSSKGWRTFVSSRQSR